MSTLFVKKINPQLFPIDPKLVVPYLSAMTFREQFANRIESFLSGHSMAPTLFGRYCMNDPNFVFEIRGGRNVSIDTLEHITKWMKAYDVAHPVKEEVTA